MAKRYYLCKCDKCGVTRSHREVLTGTLRCKCGHEFSVPGADEVKYQTVTGSKKKSKRSSKRKQKEQADEIEQAVETSWGSKETGEEG